ncbi:hypothetical protein [Aliikangiella sp. IMCC44359]|uniref:hypothetical protein n=1 Tax=Aliikangiella sp. IMCC44359 TaxID=3459125 RepID=UPI00403B0663
MGRLPSNNKSEDNGSNDSFVPDSNEHKIYARQRGVKASRIKLEKALHAAGLKTQAALANIIADKENLDSPPKDLVNKAFRERSVEPQTIERIANALGVEAYTLYLSSSDTEWERTTEASMRSEGNKRFQPRETVNTTQRVIPQRLTSKRIWSFGAVLIIGLVSWSVYFFIQDKNSSALIVDNSAQTRNEIKLHSINEASVSKTDMAATQQPSMSVKSVGHFKNIALSVLSSPENEVSAHLEQMLSDKLRILLKSQYRLSSTDFHLLSPDLAPWELPSKIGVDFVVQSRLVKKGRYFGLFIYLINSKHKYIALTDAWQHFPTVENITRSAQRAVQQIEKMISEAIDNRLVTSFPVNEAALTSYLNGAYYQDKALITENLTRAQTEFSRALRIAPSFHKARAALCDNLVRLSIANGDKSLLKDAELECLKIREAAPELADFYYAMGQVNRKMGNLQVSQDYYKNALKLEPRFTDALLGLAESHIALANQQGDVSHFEKAIQFVEQAESISPDFWKAPLIKGRAYFYSGQPQKGIVATQRSVDIVPNITNLNNLASVQFCTGDFKDAKSNFEKLVALDNAPSVSYYNLGLINFYLGEYEYSSENIKYYIDSFLQDEVEGNYMFWTGLADSYRYFKEIQLAHSAYQVALQQIEVERLKGVNQGSLESYTIYIQLALSEINDVPLTNKSQKKISKRLEKVQKLSKDPYSKAYIVLSWSMLKEYEKAMPIYRELSQSCQGFLGHPALKPLRKILLAKK